MDSFSTHKPFSSFAQAMSQLGLGKVVSARPMIGGDINHAYKLELADCIALPESTIFMKANSRSNADFFRSEVEGLEAIASLRILSVPRILGWGVDDGQENPLRGSCSFLLLEFLPPTAKASNYWEELGRNLARLHLTDCSSIVKGFGFPSDNYIGATPQTNRVTASWVEFFRECRLRPQFQMAVGHFTRNQLETAERLMGRLEEFLPEPEKPSLLHGDLWGGNVHTGGDGQAWLIDPAAYCGHWEADLAMTRLFGGFPRKFYESYNQVNPIPPSFSRRLDLYNLYHLLNHLNLFGSSYLGQVLDTMAAYK